MNNTNQYSHYYLYAKGWYKKTDLIKDLQQIQSNYCGIDSQYVRVSDILFILLSIVYKHIANEQLFLNFITDLRNDHKLSKDKQDNTDIDIIIIKRCLLVLSATIIKGTLSKPDKKILPLIPGCLKKWNELNC